MIFGNIDNLGNQENYSLIILEALEILKSGKWNNVENGKYEIKGEEMFIMISSYETGDEEGKFAESHKKYLDVQFIQEGVEAIKVINDTGKNKVKTPYDDAKDIMFFEKIEDESTLIMKKGDFAVFYPEDIHKPCCTYLEKSFVKKAVIKIKI